MQLGRLSAQFRCFTETDGTAFLFVCKYAHGMTQRIYASRKHVKEVSSILLQAHSPIFQRYVIAFNILHSLIVDRSLQSGPTQCHKYLPLPQVHQLGSEQETAPSPAQTHAWTSTDSKWLPPNTPLVGSSLNCHIPA